MSWSAFNSAFVGNFPTFLSNSALFMNPAIMSDISVSKSDFLTKLLTSGILFSTAVNAQLVAKPLTLGISPFISVILALQSVFLKSPLVSEIFFS